MSEGDAGTQQTGLLPKVPIQKPGTYQPSFHSSNYPSSTLPKIHGNQNAAAAGATTTYLPSISQAFVKPAKQTKVSNGHRHYA